MSFISVDFVSLDIQIQRLTEYTEFVKEMQGNVRRIYRPLSDMNMNEAENDMTETMRLMSETSEQLESAILKLRRITELYAECENRIAEDISDLPCNMPFEKTGSMELVFGEINSANIPEWLKPFHPANIRPDSFLGHTVINEDWLDELIF